MGYVPDLNRLSIEAYKEILKNQYMLPSRKILHQDMDRCFDAILRCSITNLAELKSALSSKEKLGAFADRSGLSEEYLVILRREINSIEPKAVLIKEFPDIEESTLAKLSVNGIKSSKDYYERYEKDREELILITSICIDKVEELYCLCDLVRINGVGAAAARSFYEAGYRSVRDIADTTSEAMLDRVGAVNIDNRYYKVKLGVNDMQFCIDYAGIIKSIEDAMK